ncbi:unnamed protein product [Rotaria socialis]
MCLEIFYLIWLDANANGKETRDTEQKLRSIINNLKKFQDVKQCQKYIEERSKNDRLVMKKALWWYTRESFFYKTLNAALRNQNIHIIFLFRGFISDIHRQLKAYQANDTLRVYRSQMISSNELETLRQSCDQFISINSFFSTSIDKEQALSFLNSCDVGDNIEPVLFEIDANPALVTSKPFADVSLYSEFTDESEVLFMLGSIFRLKNVKRRSDGKVWIVRMTLCSDDDHDLKQAFIDMKDRFLSSDINLQTLVKLLWEMGELNLAEKYFMRLLEQLSPDDPLLGDLYHDLERLASNAGNLNKSMEWRQKAIALKNQKQPTSKSTIPKQSSSTGKFVE